MKCLQRNRTKIQLLLILMFVSSSCFYCYGTKDERLPTVDNSDQYLSFVSGGNCSPPCWNELKICQTHIDETIDLLNSSNYLDLDSGEFDEKIGSLDSCNEIVEDKEYVAISIMCKNDEDRVCARLTFYDNILQSVSYYPNYKLSLMEIIEIFGEPESVSVEPWGPECMACDMDLFYPDINLVIGHSSRECSAWGERCMFVIDGEPLDPNIQVSFIGIAPDSYFEKYLNYAYYDWPGIEE